MLTPTRIEARNLRSIRHAVVEPLSDGITSLAGRNGSGKSSLLTAMLWCLYGDVGGIPSIPAQADLRRDGTPDGEPVEAIVEFTLNGSHCKAVRRLHRSKSGRDSAKAELWIDGVQQPQITPTKLTDKITALTGLTGRAFSGAFFIPQGFLPAIADGTPAEVQRLIEDQTGLTPLARRIDYAKGEARDAESRVEGMPGSVEDVAAAQSAVDTAQAAAQAAWIVFEAAQSRDETARTLADDAVAARDSLLARARAAATAREKVAALTAKRDALTDQITDLHAQHEASPVTPVGEARAAFDATRSLLASYRQAANTARTAIDAATRARADLTSAQAALAASSDPTERVTAAERGLDEATRAYGGARAEHARLTTLIEGLRALPPDAACCPTCTQHVPDARALMADLLAHQDKVIEQGIAARDAVTNATTERDAATAATAAHHATVSAHTAATNIEQTATAHARDAHAAAATARAALADRVGCPVGADTETDAEAACDAWATQISQFEHACRIKAALDATTAAREETVTALAAATDALTDTPDPDELDAAQAAAATATANARTVSDARQAAETEAKVQAERARLAESVRDAAQAALNAKADEAERADTARHAATLLGALRRELLTEYTASISAAATDLLAQIGEGVHTGVHIDENFIPAVILADGSLRPMKVLSGGEKMRAALCLRLGIADQITGATGDGMVFADEITANSDPEATALIVDLIRNLGRPMVIVAHADAVTDCANRAYRFDKPDEATGTTVTLAGSSMAPAPAPAGQVA